MVTAGRRHPGSRLTRPSYALLATCTLTGEDCPARTPRCERNRRARRRRRGRAELAPQHLFDAGRVEQAEGGLGSRRDARSPSRLGAPDPAEPSGRCAGGTWPDTSRASARSAGELADANASRARAMVGTCEPTQPARSAVVAAVRDLGSLTVTSYLPRRHARAAAAHRRGRRDRRTCQRATGGDLPVLRPAISGAAVVIVDVHRRTTPAFASPGRSRTCADPRGRDARLKREDRCQLRLPDRRSPVHRQVPTATCCARADSSRPHRHGSGPDRKPCCRGSRGGRR